MKKRITVLTTLILAVSIFLSGFSFASAQADLKDTRYRFPIIKFELPAFTTGKSIDKMSTKKVLKSKDSANGPDKLFFATIEKYPHLDHTAGVNKALSIYYPHKDTLATADWVGYEFTPKKDGGSNNGPLKGLPGIPKDAKDHGIMLHVEIAPPKDLSGTDDGFLWIEPNTAAAGQASNGYTANHTELDFNITMQEIDFNDDGTKRLSTKEKTKGEPVQTAFNVAKGGEITYIWTKAVKIKDPVKRLKKDENNQYVNGSDGKPLEIFETVNHEVGDVEVRKGTGKGGGTIPLPPAFCGYILIPFASMGFAPDWGEPENPNGKIDLKDVELVNIYTSAYPQFKGYKIIDDYCFYGPSFAKVNGAYDMTDKISNTNFKVKPVTVSAPEPSESPEDQSQGGGGGGGNTGGESKADDSAAGSTEESSTDGSTSDGTSGENSALVNSDGSVIDADTSGGSKPDKNNSWIIWLIVVLAVLLIAGAVVFFIMRNKKNADELGDLGEDIDGDAIDSEDNVEIDDVDTDSDIDIDTDGDDDNNN